MQSVWEINTHCWLRLGILTQCLPGSGYSAPPPADYGSGPSVRATNITIPITITITIITTTTTSTTTNITITITVTITITITITITTTITITITITITMAFCDRVPQGDALRHDAPMCVKLRICWSQTL